MLRHAVFGSAVLLLGLLSQMICVVAFLPLPSGIAFQRRGQITETSSRIYYGPPGGAAAGGPPAEPSFVNDELRAYAMKLHTRDQSPREGQQPASVPVKMWEPSRKDYLKFLVDSLVVYETFEDIISHEPTLASFRSTGLERSAELKADIEWFFTYDSQLDPSLRVTGKHGLAYASLIRQLAKDSLPKFMCHYYNHYFAHTAGGRMIGKSMADKLLEGKILRFYDWDTSKTKSGDVRELLGTVKKSIDEMALTWSAQQKKECIEETMSCFQNAGSLVGYMRDPNH